MYGERCQLLAGVWRRGGCVVGVWLCRIVAGDLLLVAGCGLDASFGGLLMDGFEFEFDGWLVNWGVFLPTFPPLMFLLYEGAIILWYGAVVYEGTAPKF